jgi:hypothetical protein
MDVGCRIPGQAIDLFVFVARYAGLNIGMLWSLMVFRNLVGREEVERVCFPDLGE